MKFRHIPALDGLRGFAAFWVLCGHVAQNTAIAGPLRNGWAVDLFMMISGFLMMSLHHGDAWQRPVRFWLKRLFRIVPLYYVLLTVTFLAFTPLAKAYTDTWHRNGLPGLPLIGTLDNFIEHLTLFFGLDPARQQSTMLPDWSLTLEAQFYLFFPLIALAFSSLGAIRGALCVLAVQIVVYKILHPVLPLFVFATILPLKLHIFIAGALIAVAHLDNSEQADKLHWPRLLLAAGLAMVPIGDRTLPSLLARLAMAATLSVSVMDRRFVLTHIARTIFANPLARWGGDVSYAVYLVHLPVMYTVFWLLNSWRGPAGSPSFLLALPLTIIPTYAAAQILHSLVELPGLKFSKAVLTRQLRHPAPVKP